MSALHEPKHITASRNPMEDREKAVNALGGQDLTAAEDAAKYIENAVRYDRAFELIGDVHKASHKFNQGSVIYMRYITLLARICAFGDDEFRACEQANVIKDIALQCMADDILVQINVISLLAEISSTQSGLNYMCEKGIFDWLIFTSCGAIVQTPGVVDPMNVEMTQSADPMIQIEALRVLGLLFVKAAKLQFNVFDRLHHSFILHFLQTICRYLEEGNEEERLTGLGTLADFAEISLTTLQLVIEGTGSGLAPGRLVSAWVGLLNNSKAEVSAAVLQSVAVVLNQNDEHYATAAHPHSTPFVVDAPSTDARAHAVRTPDPDLRAELGKREVVTRLKRRLVDAVGEPKRMNTVTFLMKLALQPIEVTRFAAVALMRALAAQPSGWGLQMLFQHAGPSLESNFAMYLQERMTEYCKEGKDWKFELILAVAHNPARTHLPEEINQKFDRLVAQGAYYMPPMTEVQTMEA